MNKREIRAEEKDIQNTIVQGKKDLLAGAETAGGKQEARTLAATASDIAAQGRREQMASAERIAANAITRATMSDARADDRARLSAAQTLMKESGDMLSGPTASLLSDKDKATFLADYNSAKALLQKMGGVVAAPLAEVPQNRPPLGSFKK